MSRTTPEILFQARLFLLEERNHLLVQLLKMNVMHKLEAFKTQGRQVNGFKEPLNKSAG
jgi:hypothetical protein